MPVHCGEVIADRYRVERPLGIGGMGAVVAARHLSLGELVAVKFMRPEHCGNAALLRRFQREARGMFRMKTEHVPRIYDLGALAPRPGIALPVPYIVMEHLSGNDLRSILERRGRLPVDEAAEYVRQACVALTEAHALGMVHRDLKPANLFLTYRTDGTPLLKVLDFGVAKFTSAKPEHDGLEMTTARSVMGSRRYMAPEQMLTPKDIDLRADLWALGVVLYQLVSGTLPFGAETLEQFVLVVSEKAPRPLRSVCADVPEGFEEIVMRCLEKDRTRRPASARELAAALAPFALRGAPDATLPTGVHRSQPTFTWLDDGPPTTAARPPMTSARPPMTSARPPMTAARPAAISARPPTTSSGPAETRREGRRPRRTWLAATAGAVSASATLAAILLSPGWPRAAGLTWADGTGAQHLAAVPQGLAAVPKENAVAARSFQEPDDMAEGAPHDGAASACDAPQADARGARPAARSGAGAVLSTRTAPPARAAAGSTQRAPARGARASETSPAPAAGAAVRTAADAPALARGAAAGAPSLAATPGSGAETATPAGTPDSPW
ncbi:protein kinase domain-containing protein [Sorangium sp. So ce381]|uniref:serine/threonine-protein kinase n=1 Tax=Sorangium sp. So ce381 TaxID=3133307 RepID=UPI003F5C0C42